MTSRWLPRLVLAAGALASVATSRVVTSWNLDEEVSLPPAALDQVESITYPVRIEITGAGPFPYLNGSLTAQISISPRSIPATTSTVNVRLVPVAYPDFAMEATLGFVDTTTGITSVTVPAWNVCEEQACSEDFELVITRQPVDNTVIDLTGWISLTASAEESVAPADTSLRITIGQPQ